MTDHPKYSSLPSAHTISVPNLFRVSGVAAYYHYQTPDGQLIRDAAWWVRPSLPVHSHESNSGINIFCDPDGYRLMNFWTSGSFHNLQSLGTTPPRKKEPRWSQIESPSTSGNKVSRSSLESSVNLPFNCPAVRFYFLSPLSCLFTPSSALPKGGTRKAQKKKKLIFEESRQLYDSAGYVPFFFVSLSTLCFSPSLPFFILSFSLWR